MKVQVVENVLKLNDEVAQLNRQELQAARVAAVDLLGSPGAGKTTLLERTLEALRDELHIGVLVGDLTTTRDAERLARHTEHVVQINTGKGCHLNASQVRQGLKSLPLQSLDLLIIENVGNLICPVGLDLGQDAKVGLFSVTDGDDKPAKHPYVVLESQLLLLNKIDLLPHVPFNLQTFQSDLRSIREDVELLQVSALTGEGLDRWLEWLRATVCRKQS